MKKLNFLLCILVTLIISSCSFNFWGDKGEKNIENNDTEINSGEILEDEENSLNSGDEEETNSGEIEDSGKPVELNIENIQNEDGSFTLTSDYYDLSYPENWSYEFTGGFVVLSSPLGEEDLYNENINIISQIAPISGSLDENLQEGIDEIEKKYGVNVEKESIEISGQDARKLSYKFSSEDLQIDIDISQYIIEKDGKIHVITVSNQQDDSNEFKVDIDSIIESFVLK